ncbi:MAG: phosphodiesterase [Pseudomonadota bacterium]
MPLPLSIRLHLPRARPGSARTRGDLRSFALLLRYRKLHTVFQPLADLRSGTVFGHEALIRGPMGTPMQSPDALLALAARVNQLPLFELFCIHTALLEWGQHKAQGRLFLNISADVLIGALRQHGPEALVAHIRACAIDPRMVVLEITEHARVADMQALRDAARECHSHGISLALDDFGDGHSSLRLWSEIRPTFVKIDKYFTRALSDDKNGVENLQIIHAVKGIADVFGTTLIAEGIETASDMAVLRELRIPYGQGWLLGRPAATPRLFVEPAARAVFDERRTTVLPQLQSPPRPGVLRNFAVINAPAVGLGTTNDALAGIFQAWPALHAVAVVNDERPVAVINRQNFMNHYATLYFREVHGRKPCVSYANYAPRVVELDYDVDDLVGILTSQDQRYLSDGFIVTEQGRYVGLGTGDQLVRAVTEARIETARHANPLTFLPGNIPINLHVERLLGSGVEFVACHADLNDFKPFNDHYGYWRGDEMIRLVARLAVAHCDARRDFVGHIGGDDFMVLFQSGDWQHRCERIVEDLAVQAQALFDPVARAAGGITAEDRQGQPRFFPCTTLSIGAVRVRRGEFRHADEVGAAAAIAKHDAKAARAGLYVRHTPRDGAARGM